MYCKNCGSILPEKANFCHVCGEKVEGAIAPVIEEKETKEEIDESKPKFKYIGDPEVKVKESKSYFDDNNFLRPEDEHMDIPQSTKKAFIPGLLGTILSLALGLESGLTYASSMNYINENYEKGVISYYQYLKSALGIYRATGVFMVFSALAGIILGVVSILNNAKIKSKKSKILAIISISVGVLMIVLSIFVFVRIKAIRLNIGD